MDSIYSRLAVAACSLALVRAISLVIWRLYFSPITHIPGPKLAAATYWVQFYYDCIQRGQYFTKIKEWHKIYGPILRINPEEVHFSDPEFQDEIFAGSSRKRDKWTRQTVVLGVEKSTISTAPHDLHRLRRSALNPFFSKAAVVSIRPILEGKLKQFMGRLEGFQQTGDVVALNIAFAALTNDVASEVAFGHCDNRVAHLEFEPTSYHAMVDGLHAANLIFRFPWIVKVMKALPIYITERISEGYALYIKEQKRLVKEVQDIIDTPKPIRDAQERRTIFTEILNSSKLPLEEKETERVGQDAALVVAAGMLTTAWSLSIASYFFLADSSGNMLARVKTELESAMPDPSSPPPLSVLERLPYFTACITECIRLNYGTSGRLTRCAPTEALIYTDGGKKYEIPPGTPLSMSPLVLHHDESIYPDSTSFLPERWLENPPPSHYMFSFSRGTRQCLGINLAYAELYLFLATIFRNYGSPTCRRPGDKGILELYKTDKSDVDCVADMTIPATKVGSKGVRIRVLP